MGKKKPLLIIKKPAPLWKTSLRVQWIIEFVDREVYGPFKNLADAEDWVGGEVCRREDDKEPMGFAILQISTPQKIGGVP